MDEITLAGVQPYDGTYTLDLVALELTTREWGWIKRLSGYLPLTLWDGFKGGDPELYAALSVVALHRAGRVTADDVPRVFDKLADAPFGSTITLKIGDRNQDDGDDAGDPPPPSSAWSSDTSGAESTTSSETSPDHPNGSGTPASAIAGLHPIRSGT